MTFIHCFLFFWAIFALLVPYVPGTHYHPDPQHRLKVSMPSLDVLRYTGIFLNRFCWAIATYLRSTPVSFIFSSSIFWAD